MAAAKGATATPLMSSESQGLGKTRHDVSVQLDTADNRSDVDGSSDADGDSDSSGQEDSDSGLNIDGSTVDSVTAPDVVPKEASNEAGRHESATPKAQAPAMDTTNTIEVARYAPAKPLDGDNLTAQPTSTAKYAPTESQDQFSEASTPASSGRPHESSLPPHQYRRPIAPNGPALDPYKHKDPTPGYRPKLLRPDDGRVTATVPHKLRSKLDPSSGNFATIHMELPAITRHERSTAAQRSSEATVAAAAAAANRANDSPSAATQRSSEALVAAAERVGRPPHSRHPPAAPAYPPPYPPPAYHGFPTQLPHPMEVKAQQARLLSLLRSIHPKSIVDQLCKGVSWFGGVPGAPPPPNGAFPMSENSNGSGSLFVNWLAEIFPPVYPGLSDHTPGQNPFPVQPTESVPSSQAPQPQGGSQGSPDPAPKQIDTAQPEAGPQIEPVVLPRRKRGRPKGSKATKPRKDKGIKKGPNPHRGVASTNEGGEGLTDGQSNPSYSLSSNPQQQRENATPNATPGGKRRGRPPGSKNKPKPLALTDSQTIIAQAALVHHDTDALYPRHELPGRGSPTAPRPPQAQSQHQLDAAHPEQSDNLRNPGREPGATYPSPIASTQTLAALSQGSESRKRRFSQTDDTQASHNGAQLTSQQANGPYGANSQEPTESVHAQKRRRASNVPVAQDRPGGDVQTRSPPATSTSALSPHMHHPYNPASSSGSAPQGGNFDDNPQLTRPTAASRPPHTGQHPSQQTPAMAQQRPSQQQAPQLGRYQPPTQLQKPAQLPQTWSRTMVGPQQAANPDAQPVAPVQRFRTKPADQQRR